MEMKTVLLVYKVHYSVVIITNTFIINATMIYSFYCYNFVGIMICEVEIDIKQGIYCSCWPAAGQF